MEISKNQTLNLLDAERFCLGLKMLAEECNMVKIDSCDFGVKKLYFADGSCIGGLRVYVDAGLITNI